MTSRVVVDIETVPVAWDQLDEPERTYLLKYCKNVDDEEKVRGELGLFPLTGRIIVIGLLNPDSDRALVLAEGIPGEGSGWAHDEGIEYWTGNEIEIIERFWDVINKYKQIITFNGRCFDAPYIMMRSMILGIVGTRNLIPERNKTDDHLDLLDALTHFGITRRYSLDFYMRRMGFESPKKSLSGKDVAAAYEDGRIEDIAQYCLEDIRATAILFRRFEKTIGSIFGHDA